MKKHLQTIVLFLLTLLICNENLLAQAGTLDSTFGDDGLVLKDLNAYDSQSKILKNGKMLICTYQNSLYRFHPNGTLDKTFGKNGLAYFNYDNKFSSDQNKFALQKDGKIVIVGFYKSEDHYYDAAVVRLNANGIVDSSFGKNGLVHFHFFRYCFPCGIVVQEDDKIVIAGYATQIDYVKQRTFLYRFLPDGNLDKTFGRGGIVLNRYKEQTIPGNLVIRPDGHLILGTTYDDLDRQPSYLVQSFNKDGSIDEHFGKAGKASYVFGLGMPRDWYTQLKDLAIQPDGKIVCVGTSGTGNWYMALCRFNSNGTIDSSFGNNGSIVDPKYSQGQLFVSTIDFQADDKIITLSIANKDGKGNILLTRYQPNGSLDSTFGENGYSFTHSDSVYLTGNSIHVLKDGRIFLSGFFYEPIEQNYFLLLARYNGDNTNKPNKINTFSTPTKIENANKELISIYPNPAKNVIMIKGLNKNSSAIIKIIDIQGREMINLNFKQGENISLNISKLATGNYFVQIIEDGKITRLKFIKE